MNEPKVTESQYRAINKALASINEARGHIDLADKLGYDTAQLIAECDKLEDQLKAIKAHFWPSKP